VRALVGGTLLAPAIDVETIPYMAVIYIMVIIAALVTAIVLTYITLKRRSL